MQELTEMVRIISASSAECVRLARTQTQRGGQLRPYQDRFEAMEQERLNNFGFSNESHLFSLRKELGL